MCGGWSTGGVEGIVRVLCGGWSSGESCEGVEDVSAFYVREGGGLTCWKLGKGE